MKYTVLLNRSFHLSDALEMDDEEGLYVANVEGTTIQEAVDNAVKEVSNEDKKALKYMGQLTAVGIGYLIEDAYTLVAIFDGHPKLLQHGGVTHGYL